MQSKKLVAKLLSRVVEFIDGLRSACRSERLIGINVNHVEKLDPALIRCCWMDKLIEHSFCNNQGFKVLAKNYVELNLGAFNS